MSMFRFWGSESRGCDKTPEGSPEFADCADSVAPDAAQPPTPISPKKRRPSFVDTTTCLTGYPPSKRARTEPDGGLPSPTSALAEGDEASMHCRANRALDLERAKEAIQYQFGLEILLKHDELRLINQELAKCQVALEQLRRCHLIPYPTQCPTPSQMLDISSGKGPALQSRPGQNVPKWAPPFGVVDGPYARHYAKWLIPDPMFDGIRPEPRRSAEAIRGRGVTAEGRATRNSMSDVGGQSKHRPARGMAGQRLHALSSGYPQVKDKQGPCTVKRSDGLTVKLVCIDCHRWDFSSTQGFINHCRIAHKRDFKSHEEAAVHCGHPIEADEAATAAGSQSKASVPATAPSPVPIPAPMGLTAPGLVHPLARNEPISDQQAYKDLLSRIKTPLELYRKVSLPGASRKSTTVSKKRSQPTKTSSFVGAADAPYLSQLMQKHKPNGNLAEQVKDARTKIDWDLLSPAEDSDMEPSFGTSCPGTTGKPSAPPAARTPVVMRIPARISEVPLPPSVAGRVPGTKARGLTQLGLATATTTTTDAASTDLPDTPGYDDLMDVDMSPNTITSNNAPSLVSDDGEYDDSDDGSTSDTSEDVGSESDSDVAEIKLDEDCDAPRPIHTTSRSAVKLKKDENKHVTFVTPTPIPSETTKGRLKQQA